MADAYNFGPGFQEKILAMLWRDPQFYTIYQECVRPRYFEREVHIDLARIITEFYEKYEITPTKESMVEEVRALTEKSRIKKELEADYINALSNMATIDLTDEAYVREKVVQFGRKQALTEAIMASVEDVQRGVNFDQVEDRINKATKVGEDIGDFGTFYFDTIEERMKGYDTVETEKIATGNKSMDKVMAGGLGRGELGIVIAPPGKGKTLSLINFAASGKLNGYNVVHFTLEMSEDRVTQRYDSHYVNRDKAYIKDNRANIVKSLTMLAQAVDGELIVKEYPTRTASVATMKSYLTSLRVTHGMEPDLVVVDYPDLMKPSRQYNERRTELELLYEELRGMAQELNCAVWGASQTNRGALSKEVVTIADLAESFGKAAVADFMVALSQTEKEKERGELRYFIAKSRNGQSDITLHQDVDYARMRIIPNDTRQQAAGMSESTGGGSRYERQTHENETSVASSILDAAKGNS